MITEKPLSIGTDDFKKLVGGGCYYIDKTLLIKEILDRKSEATLFTRPRRFGKTLNLSMLRYFFEDTGNSGLNAENAALFEGLAIADAGEAYTSQMQKYPVIFLTLKSAKQENSEMAYMMLKKAIADEFSRHSRIQESDGLSEAEKERFRSIMDLKAEQVHYADALKFLSACLQKVYGRKSIILLDVTIGDNEVIGAGSVVTESIPDNAIACGNPCQIRKWNPPLKQQVNQSGPASAL